MSTAIETLQRLGACRESIAFVKENNISTLAEAWDKCQRGDWLLWLAAKAGVKRETVVFAACQCARTALEHANDESVLRCIEVTEDWCRGSATLDQVREVRRSAADVCAFSAYAASAAITTTATDAYAFTVAYAAADERKASRLEKANIVRANIPFSAVEEALK